MIFERMSVIIIEHVYRKMSNVSDISWQEQVTLFCYGKDDPCFVLQHTYYM